MTEFQEALLEALQDIIRALHEISDEIHLR